MLEALASHSEDADDHNLPLMLWYAAEPLADLLVALADDYSHLLTSASTTGKNVLPRVAALKDVAQLSEVLAVESGDTFKRPIYAGNAIQTVQATDARTVITVRTASFPPTGTQDTPAPIEIVESVGNAGLEILLDLGLLFSIEQNRIHQIAFHVTALLTVEDRLCGGEDRTNAAFGQPLDNDLYCRHVQRL